MLEGITVAPKVVSEKKSSYFDEQIYVELKTFICPEQSSTDNNNEIKPLPSFKDIVEKINSFTLRRDLRIRIIKETTEKLLDDIDGTTTIPYFLISHLCQGVLKNAILHKFNNLFGEKCADLMGLSYKISDNITEAGTVFQSLRICDPTVKSGQFLRTMLNEMIAVKSQLGLLVDTEGNPLYKYKFVFENNILTVFYKKEFTELKLDGSTEESRYIMNALYFEKKALIQQCLFGVDSDPFSVLMCKIRLWIDTISTFEDSEEGNLPYIESNILCGDALISRFTLKDDLLVALKSINQTVSDYKRLAECIKIEQDNSKHQYLTELMALIKNRLIEGIGWYSKDSDELLRLRRELAKVMTPSLFPLSEKEAQARNEHILSLHAQIKKQDLQISIFRHNHAFEKAIEWRYDFPEMIDKEGNFVGFDAIIGTPPDAIITGLGNENANLYKRMNYRIYKRTGNIADLFCELANRLLVYNGYMAYIIPSEWHNNPAESKLGEYLAAEMNPLRLIELNELETSYKSLKNKCAIIVEKDINHHRTISCRIESEYNPQIADLDTYIRQYAIPIYNLVKGTTHDNTSVTSIISSNAEYMNINSKIKNLGLPIKNWDVQIYSGVMTGFDDAFIIDNATRDELIRSDYKNTEIIKPLLSADSIKQYSDEKPNKWLIYIPWHFPLQYDTTIKAASTRAEQRFQQQYPKIYNHLFKYKKDLAARNSIEVGLGFEWYALQRSGINNNWNDYSELKIVWKSDSSDFNFGIDYEGSAVLNDACFMIGQHIKFLLGVFNSTMGHYMLNDLSRLSTNETQAGISVIESMSIPVPNTKAESDIIMLVNRRIAENNKSKEERLKTESKLDALIYDLYDLNEEEIEFVKKQTTNLYK